MRLPNDEAGYKVDAKGVVHSRYATHADGRRTRTVAGAQGMNPEKVCRDCYPLPVRKPKK